MLNGLGGLEDGGADAVHLVDVADAGDVATLGLLPHFYSLCLHTLHTI